MSLRSVEVVAFHAPEQPSELRPRHWQTETTLKEGEAWGVSANCVFRHFHSRAAQSARKNQLNLAGPQTPAKSGTKLRRAIGNPERPAARYCRLKPGTQPRSPRSSARAKPRS